MPFAGDFVSEAMAKPERVKDERIKQSRDVFIMTEILRMSLILA